MKYVVIGLVLCLLSSSMWAGTLTDNFDDGDFDGWVRTQFDNPSDEWFVENGELVGVSSKDLCRASGGVTLGDNTWQNYELSSQFKLVEAFPTTGCANSLANFSTFGVGIYLNDVAQFSNFTLIDINPESIDGVVWNARCRRIANAQTQVFHQERFTVEINKWYTVQIIADGENYRISIDDTLTCDFQTNFPDGGPVMLWSHNAEVHFDNIVITGDDIPDEDLGTPTTSIEPKAKLTTIWASIKNVFP